MKLRPLPAVIALLLSACSTPNQVNVQIDTHSVVKTKQQSNKTPIYKNLYPGKKNYPITCQENCYPPTTKIKCEAPMESCSYIGDNPSIGLATGFEVHWFGHAGFKVTTPDNSQILIDPVSDQFDWPVNWAFSLIGGNNRAPVKWLDDSELKKTDAVLYSHIHYDHFNKDDITRIGSQVHYLVPLGFAKHFANNGFQINEMAWYSKKAIKHTQVHFVPAHHFSSRIQVPFIYNDDDQTLWGGWLLEHSGHTLFFAGDTGYSKHFKDIQQKYGDIDICLLPIASYYHPEYGDWYRYVHTTPEDALTAARDLNCKVMIPWGYGNHSWKMGDHSSHSALFRLLHMQQKMQYPNDVYIMNEGETINL